MGKIDHKVKEIFSGLKSLRTCGGAQASSPPALQGQKFQFLFSGLLAFEILYTYPWHA